MNTFYELLDNGTIGRSTNDASWAKEIGLTLVTDREIVYGYDGRRYFKGEEPERPVTFADYDNAMEAHLEAEKAERGYTKREPSDYAGSSNPRWAQDARDWIAHRDAVMEYGLEIENAAKRGETVPTLEEFKAALPKIVWTYSDENGGSNE